MATHSSVLAGGSHGQRSVGGYSQWSCRVEHMKLVLIWLSATNLWVLDYILLDNGKSHMVYLWAVKATDITNDGASEERAARCCRSICLPNSACRRCSYKHFLSRPAITALSWWHHKIARVSLDEFTAHTHEPMLWTLRNTHCSGSSLQSKFHPARQHLHGTASCSQLHGGQPGVQSWSLISGYAEQHVPGDSGGQSSRAIDPSTLFRWPVVTTHWPSGLVGLLSGGPADWLQLYFSFHPESLGLWCPVDAFQPQLNWASPSKETNMLSTWQVTLKMLNNWLLF